MFTKADDEFQERAMLIFKKQVIKLTVSPEKIIFLRSNAYKDAFGYCKLIRSEYEMLTDKKFFIVLVDMFFNYLSPEQQDYVLAHEMRHCHKSVDTGKYSIRKHDIENFRDMVKDPTWRTDIVEGLPPKVVKIEIPKGSRIDLNFDFDNKDLIKAFKDAIKQKEKDEKKKPEEETEEELVKEEEDILWNELFSTTKET